jgi:hypothetical protein
VLHSASCTISCEVKRTNCQERSSHQEVLGNAPNLRLRIKLRAHDIK